MPKILVDEARKREDESRIKTYGEHFRVKRNEVYRDF